LWWQWDSVERLVSGPEPGVAEAERASAGAEPGQPTGTAAPRPEIEQAERRWRELLGSAPTWPGDLAVPGDCQAVEADLSRICRVLDEQDPQGPTAEVGSSCAWIRSIADELAAHPPDVRSELESYRRMLDNVFHVYRALGRERMTVLRRTLWEKQELAEPAALALARWLLSREVCASSGGTAIRQPVLYDYSAFLFTTMGGQAYLRRRAPRIEGLASLYAIVIIDRAQSEGYDPSGVDLRPEIERTRALLAREPLVFREQYLALLDGMAERRKERSGPS